jgi:hypothetical protein
VKSTKKYIGKQGVGRGAQARRETVAIHTNVSKRVWLSWIAANEMWNRRNGYKADTTQSAVKIMLTRALRNDTKVWQKEDELARRAAKR